MGIWALDLDLSDILYNFMGFWRDKKKVEASWRKPTSGASLSCDQWDVRLMMVAWDYSQWEQTPGQKDPSVFMENFSWAALQRFVD